MLAANMWLRLGTLGPAREAYERLLDEPGLSPEQRSVLPSKIDAVDAAAARLDAGDAAPATPRSAEPNRRASIRHQLLDRDVIRQLGDADGGGAKPAGESEGDDEGDDEGDEGNEIAPLPKTPHPASGLPAHVTVRGKGRNRLGSVTAADL